MTKVESAIMAMLSKHQPCLKKLIIETLHEHPPGTVERYVDSLAKAGRIVDHGCRGKGKWAIAGAEIDLRTGKKKKPKPPPSDNLTPGHLISKMTGDYVPAVQVMRPGADDHRKHPSLIGGARVPFTGILRR